MGGKGYDLLYAQRFPQQFYNVSLRVKVPNQSTADSLKAGSCLDHNFNIPSWLLPHVSDIPAQRILKGVIFALRKLISYSVQSKDFSQNPCISRTTPFKLTSPKPINTVRHIPHFGPVALLSKPSRKPRAPSRDVCCHHRGKWQTIAVTDGIGWSEDGAKGAMMLDRD